MTLGVRPPRPGESPRGTLNSSGASPAVLPARATAPRAVERASRWRPRGRGALSGTPVGIWSQAPANPPANRAAASAGPTPLRLAYVHVCSSRCGAAGRRRTSKNTDPCNRYRGRDAQKEQRNRATFQQKPWPRGPQPTSCGVTPHRCTVRPRGRREPTWPLGSSRASLPASAGWWSRGRTIESFLIRSCVGRSQFHAADTTFQYLDGRGKRRQIPLSPGTLAFLVGQVLVVAHSAGPPFIAVLLDDGSIRSQEGLMLDAETSARSSAAATASAASTSTWVSPAEPAHFTPWLSSTQRPSLLGAVRSSRPSPFRSTTSYCRPRAMFSPTAAMVWRLNLAADRSHL